MSSDDRVKEGAHLGNVTCLPVVVAQLVHLHRLLHVATSVPAKPEKEKREKNI